MSFGSVCRRLGVALSLGFALCTTLPAFGISFQGIYTTIAGGLQLTAQFAQFLDPLSEEEPAAKASAVAVATVYALDNFNDKGNEPGEPTEGGKMKKTAWAKVKPPRNSRIVFHTFGSAFDTVLAVYRGTAFNNLARITGNDDRPVAGAGATQSLVQFDATANTDYRIQIGSKTGAEGDIFAGVFVFPPTGGLSAFMATVGGRAWGSRDYVCNDAQVAACPNPRFLLHNSTNKTLTVTASSNLGSGVTPPVQFTIGPNAIRAVNFTFTPAFNRTLTRTVAGLFTFVGSANGAEVTRAQHRALIVVGSATLGDVLRAGVAEPVVRAGSVNEVLPFDIRLTNSGSQTAIGCHARHDFSVSSRLKVKWRRIDSSTGNYIGLLDQPFGIAANQSVSLRVFVGSQQAQLADPEFPTPVTIDCANTAPLGINLANTFDLTANGNYRPVQVDVAKVAPAGHTLSVPAAGAVFRVSVVNRSATTPLRALAIYARPFDECCDASKQFQVSICRLASSNGACLAAPSTEVNYTAAKDVAAFFRVTVRPPAVNPGFDPTKRRVFFKLWQDQPTTGSFDSVVGAESVAVRKQ